MASLRPISGQMLKLRTGAALLLIFIHKFGLVWGTAPSDLTSWTKAHATFYGADDGSGTMGGACGYNGDMYTHGYGTATAALSPVLFNQGLTCGACFEIRCDIAGGAYSTKWCHPNAGSIIITATNLCPANPARTTDGWCNPPRSHFDLAYPSFAKLAERVAGIIPTEYRRVPCTRQGGLKFHISGNPYFNLVLVFNVGGAGSIVGLSIKGGSGGTWFAMTRNWGQNWQDHHKLVGQPLCFKVTIEGGFSTYVYSLTGPNWSHGSTFFSGDQFDEGDM